MTLTSRASREIREGRGEQRRKKEERIQKRQNKTLRENDWRGKERRRENLEEERAKDRKNDWRGKERRRENLEEARKKDRKNVNHESSGK